MFREGVVIYSLFSHVFNDGRIGEEARRRRRRNRYLFKSHLFKNGIVCAGRRAMYILEVMRILLEVRDKKNCEMGVDVLLYAPLC